MVSLSRSRLGGFLVCTRKGSTGFSGVGENGRESGDRVGNGSYGCDEMGVGLGIRFISCF